MSKQSRVQKKRHLAKAVTWRIIASITTALIALLFGVSTSVVGSIFILDLVLKFVLYYFHERIWHDTIKYGLR